MANILVTGGAGYIGSTTCKYLYTQGHQITVYDNLTTGHRNLVKFGDFVKGDLEDTEALTREMRLRKIDGVIHFAAKAYVGESVVKPALYYHNNVFGTISLLAAMKAADVHKLVYSSTCAVYGQPKQLPIVESTPLNPINPYGSSKAMVEKICNDVSLAHGLSTVTLRYFNACGTEKELEVGERHDPEPHLIPRILMAAAGDLKNLEIYGDDYDTPDGTCIRDYVHVSDLASAHSLAYDYLSGGGASFTCNLGTGRGLSVHELLEVAERITGKKIPVTYVPRRPGDPAALVADAQLAAEILRWSPEHSESDNIIKTAWDWYQKERS
ncbi:MAG: UDP-glucose 4-epimerase GalE [Alphaproteobacteria bacterium]|nr:UDP-glucose 4-epimerase GalE [Alphaproteobacteria bacterium]MBU1548501.1 UDP-glucose 4-epimerase GalE [Alphaproteobacteria bacterium]MBU2337697.1 UDP-glucose 4-epimerase GalE [Alphaproteobacteria bacterium]MBU2389834.1 UDP-glucose 4-epimerase GalE [Alphaproteobacteria bacterium]|tara:strand:- start:637 stop:1614 length:978 start_codon:yes stop_codon:yes gene_type:complete